MFSGPGNRGSETLKNFYKNQESTRGQAKDQTQGCRWEAGSKGRCVVNRGKEGRTETVRTGRTREMRFDEVKG